MFCRCVLCLQRGDEGSVGIRRARLQSQDVPVRSAPPAGPLASLSRILLFSSPERCEGGRGTSARHSRLCCLLARIFPAHHVKGSGE